MGFKIALGIGIFVILVMAASIAGGWFDTGARIVSAGHVEDQWRTAYDRYNALRATAAQACDMERIVAESTGEAQTQRQSQLLALRQNYVRIAGQYDAALADPFRARLVRPRDLPANAPTLSQMQATACDGR